MENRNRTEPNSKFGLVFDFGKKIKLNRTIPTPTFKSLALGIT